jgi:hypothetical protein
MECFLLCSVWTYDIYFLFVIFCMCFVLFMISIIVNIEYAYTYMLYDIG